MLKFLGFLLVVLIIMLGFMMAALETRDRLHVGDCMQMTFTKHSLDFGLILGIRDIENDRVISIPYKTFILEFKESEILYSYRDKFKKVSEDFCRGI